jgi:hypothetical protein
MRPDLITTAIINIRFIKDLLEVALHDTLEHTVKIQMNEALKQAGMVHDTLFHTREELLRLRTENAQLHQELHVHKQCR